MGDFNLVGFGNDWDRARGRESTVLYKHCIFCSVILQPDPHDDSKLMCFSCGYSVLAKEAPNEEGISIPHDKQHKPTIVSGKDIKKKYYDQQGNEVTDPEIILQMKLGKTVQYYHEEGGEDPKQKERDKGKRQVKVVRK